MKLLEEWTCSLCYIAAHRHIGETNMNLHSSRSHTIFRMVHLSSFGSFWCMKNCLSALLYTFDCTYRLLRVGKELKMGTWLIHVMQFVYQFLYAKFAKILYHNMSYLLIIIFSSFPFLERPAEWYSMSFGELPFIIVYVCAFDHQL